MGMFVRELVKNIGLESGWKEAHKSSEIFTNRLGTEFLRQHTVWTNTSNTMRVWCCRDTRPDEHDWLIVEDTKYEKQASAVFQAETDSFLKVLREEEKEKASGF
jgi:hypothetical protein